MIRKLQRGDAMSFTAIRRKCILMKFGNNGFIRNRFYCPRCFTQRPYIDLPLSIKTVFFYIALFEGGNLDHLVECQACKKAFDPVVLEPYNQNLIKLAGKARGEMLLGVSEEEMKSKLLRQGQQGDFADKLISLARI
jgi:hypothetical protein